MEYIQKFKNYLLALRPTPSKMTVKNYSLDVKHFVVWLEAKQQSQINPSAITYADIQSFVKENANRLSARSLERHLSSLRKFFQCLKLEGIIAANPFDHAQIKSNASADPYHLRQFKDFLYVYNASNLTIKNYIIDVKQFFSWAEKVINQSGIGEETESVLSQINPALVNEYKDRLISENVFSSSSINRKLSSLRKYFAWAKSQNLLENENGLQINPNVILNIPSARSSEMPSVAMPQAEETLAVSSQQAATETPKEKKNEYSPFPPFRLAQKITKGINRVFDSVFIAPLAHGYVQFNKILWVAKGKPLFTKNTTVFPVSRSIEAVKNISKAFYSPLSLSTKDFPWYKKLFHHARYTRPNWYKRYHSYALAHYFNWAILMIVMTIIGFGFYNGFAEKPKGQQLLAATAPPRILSFQGRLTDTSNNPITTATNLRFAIYTDATSTGSALLWQEVDSVSPDSNGVFSIILGKGSTLQQSIFANNANLFLGIAVGQTAELTPRQQLATVAYATNAETLQGLPPITQSGAGTQNVVLALNSSGNLSIGAASTFQTTGGAFTLAGDALIMNTNAGTNGNITLAPDGTGFIDLQKPLRNTTNSGNIPSAIGSVEVDDTFAVLATNSGVAAVTINQNGSAPIFTASSSGVSKFTIGNTGTITANNYTTAGGVIYTDSTGLFSQTTSGLTGQCLTSNGGTAPTWSSCSSGGAFWTLANGTLYPVNSTLDFLIGGSSTAAAKFAVLNVDPGAAGTAVASVSAQNAAGQAIAINSAGTIQTLRNAGLTIGGNTTGNITLSPLGGSGTVTVDGTGLQTTAATFNLFTNTATSLSLGVTGGTTTVNSALTVTGNFTPNGQLAASLIPTSTAINLGSSTNNFGSVFATNLFLPTTNGIGGYWQLQNGALSPTNVTNDILAGGTATTTAKFSVLNMTGSGTPVASVSSGLSGNATYMTADGTLQTARFQGLTIGGTTTGNITLKPLGGTNGTITFSGYGTGLIHSNSSGLLSSSAVNLAGGATEITGFLPTGNGGLGGDVTPAGGGEIVYSTSATAYTHLAAGTVGYCLISNGTLAPSWTSCSNAASNFWTVANGALFPINTTLDVLIGGGATSTAKFSVLNMTGSGTPVASVSSGLNGVSAFLTATGILATTNMQPLTLGNTTTGAINIGTDATARSISIGNNTTTTSVTLTAGTGNINLNAPTIATNQTTIALLNSTATTVNFASAASTLTLGATTGITTFATPSIDDSSTGLTLFVTPTTVNFGTSSQTVNVKGNATIGTSTSNTILLNGLVSGAGVNNAVQPTGTLVTDLGSASHYWGTVYAANFVAPVSGGTSGFWQLTNNVISPVNFWNDLAIGGNATGSATPWQVFATTLGVNTAGTATSSAGLSFRGTNTNVALLNGSVLNVKTSVGGDSGLTTQLTLANNGDLTLSGANIITTQSTLNLFNTTATLINFGGGATTGIAFGNANGTSTLHGNLLLGDVGKTINPVGHFSNDLLPDSDNTRSLGDNTTPLRWRNLYLSGNFFQSATSQYSGFWQRNNGILSPINITDDLTIGGLSTGSATPWQIFGKAYTNDAPAGVGTTVPAGTATSSAGLTFRGGTTDTIRLLDGTKLSIWASVGGDAGLGGDFANPILSVIGHTTNNANNPNGSVVLGSSSVLNTHASLELLNNPNGIHLAQNAADTGGYIDSIGSTSLLLNGGSQYNPTAGLWTAKATTASSVELATGRTYFLNAQGLTAGSNFDFMTTNNIAGYIDEHGKTGLGGSASIGIANAQLIVNQVNNSGLGDIFTASASGLAKFTIANDGSIKNNLIPNITDTYDLGSNPSLPGGREWNNLYVRQIITPNNSGIAGFWQLNNGALSPTNLTNDVLVGSIATSSATVKLAANVDGSSFINTGMSGKFGIDTSTPSATLQVAGDLQVGKDTTPWGVSGYSQRRQVSVTNNSGTALTDYQVRIIIDTASLISAGKMLSSCNDIRFTDTDGTTQLGYWLENGCNTNYTTFWVKVPTIGFPNKTIYAYYNNSAATNASSTASTFVREIGSLNAAYTLDEPTYDPIQDHSGNGNVATASGTTVLSPGKFGNARTFNGTTDIIVASPSATIDTAAPLSLSTWFKTTQSTNGVLETIDSSSGTRNRISITIGTVTAGKIDLRIIDAGTTDTVITSANTYNDGNWHHAVATLAGSSIGSTYTLYVDGVSVGSSTLARVFSAPNGELNIGALNISAFNAARTNFFSGSLDEVRVYSKSLSSAEVTDLYGNGGNNIGYTSSNNQSKEEVAAYTATAPGTYLNPEQSTLQTIPSFYVQNTTGNVSLGTLTTASTSARLTVAGNLKVGLWDNIAWGSNWTLYQYRSRILVDNTKASTDLTNYIVRTTINTSALIANGKMRSDCGDIRFADADGNTNLTYWVENGTCNNTATPVNIKVPTIPGSASKNVYMYYGNPAVTSNSASAIFTRTITGVKGAWRFDETSGTSVTDYSGNSNTGTATGTVIQGGYANNARFFNGASDYVSVADSASLQQATPMSLSAWFNTSTNTAATQCIVRKDTQTGTRYLYDLLIDSSFNIEGHYFNGTSFSAISNSKLNDGKWHHAVMTISGTTLTLYIDGVAQTTTATITGTQGVPTGEMDFGACPPNTGGGRSSFFTGAIDEVRLYNAALSAAEITDLYNSRTGYGYVTTNAVGNEYVRTFNNPEPAQTVDTEQDPSQVDPVLFADNTFQRVGINTANPTGTLDLVSNEPANISRSAFHIETTNDGVFLATWTRGGASLGDMYHNNNSGLVIESFATTAGAANTIILNPGGGNVGIGTASPTQALDVNGIITGSSFKDRDNQAYFIDPAASGTSLQFAGQTLGADGTAGTPTYSFINNTNMGFYRKQNNVMAAVANGQEALMFSGDTGVGTMTIGNIIPVNEKLLITGAGTMDFMRVSSDNSETGQIFTIKRSGNVGIGTTGPNRTLHVKGGGNGGGQQMTFENPTAGGATIAVGPDASTNCFTIYPSNGSGLFFCPGNTGWSSNSDQRLKTNIQPIATSLGSSLSLMKQLNPVSFNWKDINNKTLQLGFIAQQVQQLFPELVSTGGTPIAMKLADGSTQVVDNPLAINYLGLLTPAIQAIKELDASNSATLAQVQKLESLELTQTGDVNIIANATPSAGFTIPHYYTLTNVLGDPISRMGAFAELVVGNFRAGIVSTQQLFTNSLAIATDNVSIAGQSLRDYIIGVVRTSDLVQNGTLSPIAAVDQIHTNLISPLASNSAITIDLQNSKFTIRKSASGSAVASIDNVGNATFSGTIKSQNLAVNADATVSGTLRAHRIVADEIAGLSAAVGTLSAQNITNVTNIYFATPSGRATGGNYAMGQYNPSSTASGLLAPYLGYTNIASYSSFLAYVPNLAASTAMFDQGLMSLGPTSLSDTTITGQLSIGTSLILANNSINVLGSSFEIQPLRQGGVNFEGGLLAIDTDGNLTVNGNAVFSKNLAANVISPLSNNRDLTFKLGENPTATGSALATASFAVQNASGSGIFAINQLGDIVSSGAANINKLNFNLVQPALAVSNVEVIATGSAGTTFIKSHQTEVTIDNPLVTDKSLIYITPVGQSAVTPYLLRQVNKTSFTVGIPLQQLQDTTFNWLIVN